jgi:ribosomal protein L11 methyltransferase
MPDWQGRKTLLERMVLAAHHRQGLMLERKIDVEPWTTLVLRKR